MFERYRNEIGAQFEEYIRRIPVRESEYRTAAESVSGDLALLFKKAVTQLIITDAVLIDTEQLMRHVRTILQAFRTMEYSREIPCDIFFDFVLPYRVNDEDFAVCSDVFYQELVPMTTGKSLTEAAKEVNYWCLSKATYRASDDRTKNALATVNAGWGRCGEESLFTVSALRSVGIPARQVYSPYWLHCDDNHAWVEVFTGEKWEFMGACEPESELNRGWFTHAASKAGVVRSRVFGRRGCGGSGYGAAAADISRDGVAEAGTPRKNMADRLTADENSIFTTLDSTGLYAATKKVFVSVPEHPHTKVGVYTINYGKMSLLREKRTDEKGEVLFETGLADLIYFVYADDGFDIRTVTAEQTEVRFIPGEGQPYLEFDLSVPEGRIPESFGSDEEHRRRVALLDEKRKYAHAQYFQKAGFNAPEIRKFLGCDKLSARQKELVLDTLSEKDFCDVKAEVLLDTAFAFSYKTDLPEKIFRGYVLKMRVKNEPLYPHRQMVRTFWPEETRPKTANELCARFLDGIKRMDDLAYPGVTGSLEAVLRTGITVSENVPVHMVQLLRAFGFAARLSEQDGIAEYFDGAEFVPVLDADVRSAQIEIRNRSGKTAVCGEDFTVSRINEKGIWEPLRLEEHVKDWAVYSVREGLYACVQARRQIDGAMAGKISFTRVGCGETGVFVLTEGQDRTAEKLKNVSADGIFEAENKTIAAYIEPGKEPTEHFLNELMENAERLREIEIHLFAGEETDNRTLKRTLESGICDIKYEAFDEKWIELRRQMGVGDERLPFAAAAENGIVKFAFANYNVGTVETLMRILGI